jgi:hypothetical protein
MSKLSKRDSILLLMIAAIVLIGGIYWFYVKPARADLSAKQTAAQEAQDRVDQLQSELQKLTAKATKPRSASIFEELRLAKAYPYTEDIPVLILQIEDLARQSNVELGEATPGASTDYAGVTGTPFTISVKGKFFDVQDFLYRMHNRVRLDGNGKLRIRGRMLAVTQADLSPGAEGESSTSGGSSSTSANQLVSASITIVAFSRTAGSAAGDAATTQTSNNSGGATS